MISFNWKRTQSSSKAWFPYDRYPKSSDFVAAEYIYRKSLFSGRLVKELSVLRSKGMFLLINPFFPLFLLKFIYRGNI